MLLIALGALAAAAPPSPPQQNFIFFQPDEMRAESLGCYGTWQIHKIRSP